MRYVDLFRNAVLAQAIIFGRKQHPTHSQHVGRVKKGPVVKKGEGSLPKMAGGDRYRKITILFTSAKRTLHALVLQMTNSLKNYKLRAKVCTKRRSTKRAPAVTKVVFAIDVQQAGAGMVLMYVQHVSQVGKVPR